MGIELAAYMPGGHVFHLIAEGTEKFSKYIKELEEGTIWESQQGAAPAPKE
jgi:hypothetical protein